MPGPVSAVLSLRRVVGLPAPCSPPVGLVSAPWLTLKGLVVVAVPAVGLLLPLDLKMATLGCQLAKMSYGGSHRCTTAAVKLRDGHRLASSVFFIVTRIPRKSEWPTISMGLFCSGFLGSKWEWAWDEKVYSWTFCSSFQARI